MIKSQVVWTWKDFRAMEARVSALEAKDAHKDFPKIYDVQTDTLREITKTDVEDLLAIKTAYGKLRETFQKIQKELQDRLWENSNK